MPSYCGERRDGRRGTPEIPARFAVACGRCKFLHEFISDPTLLVGGGGPGQFADRWRVGRRELDSSVVVEKKRNGNTAGRCAGIARPVLLSMSIGSSELAI